jgi:hypothetical protein
MRAMPQPEELVCWECISDPVLRDWLREVGHAGTCDYCGKRRIACTLCKLARHIDDTLREFYRPAAETAHVVEESDNPQYWAEGQDAAEIIEEIAGVERPLADDIVDYLSDVESSEVRDGADAYYDGSPLEHIPIYPDEFMRIWFDFEIRLKHEVRFFDEDGRHSLDELFEELPTIAGGKAIVTIEPAAESSILYRARIASDKAQAESFLRKPAQNLGPPPFHLARPSRMNPVGIPAFYGAFAEDVAIAEVRPAVGSIVAIGRFAVMRTIRLLDVSFLPFAYHQESIFSSAYDHLRNKVGFLEKFHRRISRPVLPSDEALEYLPTQAVAAYVQNVMGLDGMIYGSTQMGAEQDPTEQVERALCNVVLFGKAARVVGGYSELRMMEPPEPPIFFPGTGFTTGDPEPLADPEVPPADTPAPEQAVAQPEPEATGPILVATPVADAPSTTEGEFTLRIEPQPKLVKIAAVKVETSSIFGHLYDNGSVIIDDHDDDD